MFWDGEIKEVHIQNLALKLKYKYIRYQCIMYMLRSWFISESTWFDHALPFSGCCESFLSGTDVWLWFNHKSLWNQLDALWLVWTKLICSIFLHVFWSMELQLEQSLKTKCFSAAGTCVPCRSFITLSIWWRPSSTLVAFHWTRSCWTTVWSTVWLRSRHGWSFLWRS